MSEKFVVPATAAEADEVAGQLGEIATAVDWKRAAIVFARVQLHPKQGRPKSVNLKSDILMSPEQYAQLGIHGLRSATTVRRYHRAWQKAVDEGIAVPAQLGVEVDLPDTEWETYYTHVDLSVSVETDPPPINLDSCTCDRPPTPQSSPKSFLDNVNAAFADTAMSLVALTNLTKKKEFGSHLDEVAKENREWVRWAAELINQLDEMMHTA